MNTLTSLRGPARVVVRQHRWTLWIAGGLALVAVAGLIAVALRASHVAEVFAASNCPVDGGAGRLCDVQARSYSDSTSKYRSVFTDVALVLTALPAVFSAFVAGPLIARELESGTFKLSWTQSVSPARWLAAKLAVPTVLLLTGTVVLAAALHWARSHADTPYASEWHTSDVFATTGTVPAAHVLFGLCVGALVGLLARRTLLALSVSALVTGATIMVFRYWRGELWPTRTLTGPTLNAKEGMWWVESGDLTSSGVRVPHDLCNTVVSCMTDHDITAHYLDYHPASHFWPIQLVETGILLALAALALTLAFRVLRRRTA
ncbi:hypothetical protein ACFYQ5_32255 [Streptomyces sp. NPDC005794]|uniref:hypothetical protein n=1 Tax=Streptomyces sp. NPDC005794 TaxID=3364733 RepID=UPI00369DE3CF